MDVLCFPSFLVTTCDHAEAIHGQVAQGAFVVAGTKIQNALVEFDRFLEAVLQWIPTQILKGCVMMCLKIGPWILGHLIGIIWDNDNHRQTFEGSLRLQQPSVESAQRNILCGSWTKYIPLMPALFQSFGTKMPQLMHYANQWVPWFNEHFVALLSPQSPLPSPSLILPRKLC
jgi:hypothetical protein